MLYITYEDKETTWHINESIDKNTAAKITEIQADGDELAFIQQSFSNIPMPLHRRVVRWYGEIARFIIVNL
jgi:hypothetical protein